MAREADAVLMTRAGAEIGVFSTKVFTTQLARTRGAQTPRIAAGIRELEQLPALGELKHGPLALFDERIPVIALVPSNALVSKLLSSIEEVRSRGGRTTVFVDERGAARFADFRVIALPASDEIGSAVVFAVALQLLADHVAALLGTDIDQPRNLAKSVTVE